MARIHAIADVQNELRRRSRDARPVRDVVKRPAQLRMLGDVVLDVLQALARGPQGLLEFRLGFGLGVAQGHLHAAVRVDLALSGRFDGQENHVPELIDDRRLHAVGLGRRHAAERLQGQHHVAQVMDRVVDVLAHLEMPFPAARKLVVEGMSQLRQLGLRRQRVGDAAQMPDDAVVEVVPQRLAHADQRELLPQGHLIGELLLQFPPFRMLVRARHRPLGFGMGLALVQQVGDPRGDRLDQHLRALAFEEGEHVEVAVAFGRLGPEFAGDLDDGLDAGAVHFNRVQHLPALGQRIDVDIPKLVLADFAERVQRVAQGLARRQAALQPRRGALHDLERGTLAQRGGEPGHGLLEDAVRLARIHLERTDLVDDVVHHVAGVQGVQHAQAEIDGELQARLSRRRFQAVLVMEEQDAEAVEPRIFQREAVLGLVHPEAAGPARAGREEDVVVEDLLARDPRFFQRLKMLHEVSDREVGRVALAVVAVFLADLKGGHVGHGQPLALVVAALKDGANQLLVLPGEAAKENGDASALFGGEGALEGPAEMRGIVQAGERAQAALSRPPDARRSRVPVRSVPGSGPPWMLLRGNAFH